MVFNFFVNLAVPRERNASKDYGGVLGGSLKQRINMI